MEDNCVVQCKGATFKRIKRIIETSERNRIKQRKNSREKSEKENGKKEWNEERVLDEIQVENCAGLMRDIKMRVKILQEIERMNKLVFSSTWNYLKQTDPEFKQWADEIAMTQ